MNLEILTDTAGDRASLYSFYGRIFQAEIDEVFIEGLRTAVDAQSDLLKDYLISLNGVATSTVAQDLRCDYARLFLGMGPKPVAPYESVFLSEEHILMQEQRDQVVALFRTEGVVVEEGFGLPEDHLAVELAFMAYLCKKTQQALAQSDDEEALRLVGVQKQFLEDHLVAWVSLFADEVAACESKREGVSSFYVTIAAMMQQFIIEDSVFLAS